jgi:hypothetical protein
MQRQIADRKDNALYPKDVLAQGRVVFLEGLGLDVREGNQWVGMAGRMDSDRLKV